jgi:ASC-1-like (ASCH) protein
MSIIKKKILPEYFEAVASGKKTYELRLNDFDVMEGDTLVLGEWDADRQAYTGRSIEKRVIYVNKFKIDELFWPKEDILEKGIQIISLE